MYSARNIFMDPSMGYVAWGGDTYYHRPLINRWDAIDLDKVKNSPAEKALATADQQKGNKFRVKANNICNIATGMWPGVMGKVTGWFPLAIA